MSGDRVECRVWADEGLLEWDGLTLELHGSDSNRGGWRVDAGTIDRWVLDDTPPAPLVLRLHTTSGDFVAATIPPSARDELDEILLGLDRGRAT